jgi:hypothetical protein
MQVTALSALCQLVPVRVGWPGARGHGRGVPTRRPPSARPVPLSLRSRSADSLLLGSGRPFLPKVPGPGDRLRPRRSEATMTPISPASRTDLDALLLQPVRLFIAG